MPIESLFAAASAKVAIDSIYYVARLIRHRAGLAGSMSKLVAKGLKNEPSPDAVRLAERVIKAIEDETNSPLAQISPEVASSIINDLERLASERFSEGHLIDTTRGEALLRELRNS